MPAKEIKELRQSGKLEEALTMAESELQVEPENLWAKRNISWVYYDYLKLNSSAENTNNFISWLNKLKILALPEGEKMLFEQIAWQIGKMVFNLLRTEHPDLKKEIQIFEIIQDLPFPKKTEAYSFLFKALHKSLKDGDYYIQFAEWWDFSNFLPSDFEKEKLPNGKEVMSIVEQAYITFAKHLLPRNTSFGQVAFAEEKANIFIPKIASLCESHPSMQYPPYFHAKLLLASGNKNEALIKLLPFARKKRNDFWVWDILAELFPNNPEKIFSCYCKALSCRSPEEMLTKTRQKFAGILISKKHFNEAKTEIEQLIKVKNELGHSIPSEVNNWTNSDWYKSATKFNNNYNFYKNNSTIAEEILFQDLPKTKVFVEFVNTDKKILNFMTVDNKRGFFKYENLISRVKIGDILEVRFKNEITTEMNQVFTLTEIKDENFESNFIKKVEGKVRISEGKNFGFLDDIYVHPTIVSKYNLVNSQTIKAKAIKTWNKEKKSIGWKILEIFE